MNFYLTGVGYKTAPIEIRETVYKKRADIAGFWEGYSKFQTAILSTCNRIEVYAIGNDDGVMDIFKSQFREFSQYGYGYSGKKEIFRHLVRLATGLESQIKGEAQILQQLKLWGNQAGFAVSLNQLLRDCFAIAYDVRLRTHLKGAENNLATLLFEHIAGRRKNLDVVIAGTGKIAELFAKYKPQGVHITFASHKNFNKAKALALAAEGEAISFKELPEALFKADILLSATASPHIVFGVEHFLKLSARKKALEIYDLAMPRDVSQEVRHLRGIILKNIDDLAGIFEKHNLKLRDNLKLAEYLVEESIRYYERNQNADSPESWHKAEPLSY
ncbi:MAG: hypothetical protein AB1481_05305 [Candidatus Omnitrophota bacterium]